MVLIFQRAELQTLAARIRTSGPTLETPGSGNRGVAHSVIIESCNLKGNGYFIITCRN